MLSYVGCDLVIGHHSHTLGAYEEYNGKYIFYSLGNLFFPKIDASSNWRTGLVLRISVEREELAYEFATITFDESFDTALTSGWLTLDDWVESYEVYQITDADYKQSFETLVSERSSDYLLLISVPLVFRGLFRLCNFLGVESFLIGNRSRLLRLNLLRCASHRDLAIKALARKVDN